MASGSTPAPADGKVDKLVTTMYFESAKQNSVRFDEEARPRDESVLTAAYIGKKALARLRGNQKRLRITIEAIGDETSGGR